MLQRGRARAGAEIWILTALPAASVSFNGAAPARARKLGNLPSFFVPVMCFNGAAPARARKYQYGSERRDVCV